MIVLGAVLLVVVVLFALGSVFNGTDVTGFKVFGVTLDHVSVGGLLVTGIVTGALAMFALSLLLGGGARKRHKAVARKRELRSTRGQAETLEQENARLREELTARTSTGTTRAVDEPGRRG